MTQNRKFHATIAMIVVAAIIAILAFAINGAHKAFAIDSIGEPKGYIAHESMELNTVYHTHRLAPRHSSNEEMFRDWRSNPQAFIAWMREENGNYRDYRRATPEDQQIADQPFIGPNCEIYYNGNMYWFVDDQLFFFDNKMNQLYEMDPTGKKTLVASFHKPKLTQGAFYHWYYQQSDGLVYNDGLYELTFDGENAGDPGVVHLWHYNVYEGIAEEILSFESHEAVKFFPKNSTMDPNKCLLWIGGKRVVEASKDGLRDIFETPYGYLVTRDPDDPDWPYADSDTVRRYEDQMSFFDDNPVDALDEMVSLGKEYHAVWDKAYEKNDLIARTSTRFNISPEEAESYLWDWSVMKVYNFNKLPFDGMNR